MTGRTLPLFGCLLLAACAPEAPEPEPAATGTAMEAEASSGPAFLALHVYNPASDEEQEQFLDALSQLNQAVADAGHPETRYQAWKVTGEQAGDYGYLFGSIWADRATYDAVHAHEAYTAVTAALDESGREPIADQLYNRYVELNPATTEPAGMPEDATPLLALHLFNLPSADSEAEFIALLDEFNRVIGAAGHPETRYTFWKVTDEQAGPRGYLFGSVWANQAAYDAVHADPAYQSLVETHGPAFERLVLDEVYNRYEYAGPM